MPDSPTNCFADSPIESVKPTLGEYTPLKNDSTNPLNEEFMYQYILG